MEAFWEAENEVSCFITKLSSHFPFLLKLMELGVGGIFSSKQQIKHSFWEWLLSSGCLLSSLAKLRNRMASECDTSHWVKCTTIIEHKRKSSHSKNSIINFNISDNLFSFSFTKAIEYYKWKIRYIICVGG